MLHAAVAAAVAILFMTLMRHSEAQTVTEPSSDKVTNLCTEAKYTEYLANHIVGAAENQEREIYNMEIYGEAWNLLAASTNQTDKRAATYALAAYMSAAAAKARRIHNVKYKAAVETSKLLHRRAALTRTLLAMTFYGRTLVGQDIKEAGAVSTCTQMATPMLAGDRGCGHQRNNINQPEAIPFNLKAATHIKLLNSSKLRPLGLTHSVEIKETKGKEKQEAIAYGCGDVLGGNHYVKFVASTTEKDNNFIVEPIKIFEGSDASTNCAVMQNESIKSEKDNDLLINKICNYIKKPDPQIITISSLTPITLANATEVQLAFKSFLHQTRDKSSARDNIEAQLQKLYGGDKQNFTNDFIKLLRIKKLTYHTGSGFVTETLLDALKNKNAHKALIYLEDQRPTQEAKQAYNDEAEINGLACGGEGQEECKLDEKKDMEKPNETQMRKWPKALKWMMARQGGNCKTIRQEDCKEECAWEEGACDGAVGLSASMHIPLFMAFLLLA
uniref:Variant surface glycoprotein 485 n=1 Tax=Trypanosoma brucei TaxID=5691 RepID=M4SX57_9TRYP|nr:variant surface glycoprotein 485 [Trypanosoma brucei]